MENLILALQIFLKYQNPEHPTHCSHDELWIMGDYSAMTPEDEATVKSLGFLYDESDDSWKSFKYGSA